MKKRFALAAAVLGLGGCTDHTDFSGTYVGEATITTQRKGEERVTTHVPDTVIVQMTDRQYQYSSIRVVARNCVASSGEGGGETSYSLSTGRGGGACELDVPNIGTITLSMSGGLEREPASRSVAPKSIHVTLVGSNETFSTVSYSITAKPQRK